MITRPLLAAKATDSELRDLFNGGRSFLLSPKIDGIRALVVGGKLVSRTMKPIRNTHTQNLFGRPELEGLDGELVVGNPWDKNLMQQTSSGVMSYDGRPDVTYHVFDQWNYPAPFEVRYPQVCTAAKVVNVKQDYVRSYQDVLDFEEHYLQQGYEGVMLRSLTGRYKQGRSTLKEQILVKVKRFEDGEAIITGTEPLYRNFNEAEFDERGYTKRGHSSDGKVADECLGAFAVRDMVSGVSFSIGSGLTEAQRYNLWKQRDQLLGKIVKYKSFKNAGVKDAPRHPIFLGFRDPEDL